MESRTPLEIGTEGKIEIGQIRGRVARKSFYKGNEYHDSEKLHSITFTGGAPKRDMKEQEHSF